MELPRKSGPSKVSIRSQNRCVDEGIGHCPVCTSLSIKYYERVAIAEQRKHAK